MELRQGPLGVPQRHPAGPAARADGPRRPTAPWSRRPGRTLWTWPPADWRRPAPASGVGVLAGGRVTVEDAYAYGKLARVALGSNDVDFRARPHSAEEARVPRRARRRPGSGRPGRRDVRRPRSRAGRGAGRLRARGGVADRLPAAAQGGAQGLGAGVLGRAVRRPGVGPTGRAAARRRPRDRAAGARGAGRRCRGPARRHARRRRRGRGPPAARARRRPAGRRAARRDPGCAVRGRQAGRGHRRPARLGPAPGRRARRRRGRRAAGPAAGRASGRRRRRTRRRRDGVGCGRTARGTGTRHGRDPGRCCRRRARCARRRRCGARRPGRPGRRAGGPGDRAVRSQPGGPRRRRHRARGRGAPGGRGGGEAGHVPELGGSPAPGRGGAARGAHDERHPGPVDARGRARHADRAARPGGRGARARRARVVDRGPPGRPRPGRCRARPAGPRRGGPVHLAPAAGRGPAAGRRAVPGRDRASVRRPAVRGDRGRGRLRRRRPADRVDRPGLGHGAAGRDATCRTGSSGCPPTRPGRPSAVRSPRTPDPSSGCLLGVPHERVRDRPVVADPAEVGGDLRHPRSADAVQHLGRAPRGGAHAAADRPEPGRTAGPAAEPDGRGQARAQGGPGPQGGRQGRVRPGAGHRHDPGVPDLGGHPVRAGGVDLRRTARRCS